MIVETEQRRPEATPVRSRPPDRNSMLVPPQSGPATAIRPVEPPDAASRPPREGHPASASRPTPAAASQHYDVRILRALRRIIRSVELYSKHLSVTNKITAPQLVCLLTIVGRGPVTPTAISREVHLSPSTVVGILDRLEEKGLVTRTRMRVDRRLVQVSATPAGVALAESAPSPLQKALAVALNRLPELEQATIALSLERIVALMEVEELDASPILATGPITPTAS